MHVEKGDAIAFTTGPAFNIEQLPTNLAQAADGNVTGNQWIGNTLQSALLKINVGATDLRKFDLKQSRVLFEFRTGNFAQFDRRVRLRDDGNKRHKREG